MDILKCSQCSGNIKQDNKLRMGVCESCGRVNHYAFISYSTKNQAAADYFFHTFSQQGIPVWMAPYDIPLGENYASILPRALKNCSCLVLLLSEASQSSIWVPKEVGLALDAKKPILPIQIEELELNDIFSLLMQDTQIKFLPKIDVKNPVFQQLITTVKGYTHTQDKPVSPPPPEPPSSKPASKHKPEPSSKPAPDPKPRSTSVVKWKPAAAAAALAILFLCVFLLLPKNQETAPAEPTPELQSTIPETTVAAAEATVDPELWRQNVVMENMPYLPGRYVTDMLRTEIQRSDIAVIYFLDTLVDMPEDATDASEAMDGSVMAWSVPNRENEALYDLYIAGETGVSAPADFGSFFDSCTNLTAIHFDGNLHVSNAQSMEGLFRDCPKLKQLDLSGWDVRACTNMANMFPDDTSLEEIITDGWDTSNLVYAHRMFKDCVALNNLDLSHWDTSNVETMNAMFLRCSSLENLDLGQWEVNSVTNYENFMVWGVLYNGTTWRDLFTK